MIASAASVASAEGEGCFAVGVGLLAAGLGRFAAVWGVWLQSGQASGKAGWQLCCRVGVLGCRLGRPPVRLEGCCSPPSVLALFTKTSPQCAKVPLLVGISIKNERKISFSKVFAIWGGREDTQSSPVSTFCSKGWSGYHVEG